MAVFDQWVCFNLGNLVNGRCGRHHQGIKVRQCQIDLARQLGTFIFRLHHIDSVEVVRLTDDLANHRMGHLTRDHFLYGAATLCDPGLVI